MKSLTILIGITTSFLLLCNITMAQSYINVQASANYWQHTEVFGPGIGFGYSYEANRFNISIDYEYGYGTFNRLKSMKNINYDHYSTVFTNTKKGKWREYLGITDDLPEDLEGTSDYGKQHQLAIRAGYSISKNGNREYLISAGIFGAVVEQFFTFTNIPIYNADIVIYNGPLNYIPVTSQRIITAGALVEMSMNVERKSKIFSPYLQLGIGPRYSSYASVGIRLSTMLKKNT